jgi:hypothetical protein
MLTKPFNGRAFSSILVDRIAQYRDGSPATTRLAFSGSARRDAGSRHELPEGGCLAGSTNRRYEHRQRGFSILGAGLAHDVFISYASSDKLTADAACAVLESKGLRCWMAPRDILPGVDYGEAIVNAIGEVRVFLLVFSSHANASNQIKREVERAVSRGIPVIPLRIEDVAPTKSLEYFISSPHWLDAFSPPLQRHLDYLAEVIQSLLKGETAPSAGFQLGAKTAAERAREPKLGPREIGIGLGVLIAVIVVLVLAVKPIQNLIVKPATPIASAQAAPRSAAPTDNPVATAGASLAGAWSSHGMSCRDPMKIAITDGVLSGTLSGQSWSGKIEPGGTPSTVATHSRDGDFSYVLNGEVLTMTGPEGPMELKRCAG